MIELNNSFRLTYSRLIIINEKNNALTLLPSVQGCRFSIIIYNWNQRTDNENTQVEIRDSTNIYLEWLFTITVWWKE